MFGRSKKNGEDESAHVAQASTTPTGKKGRPTPKRKAAEAARIHPLARAKRNARYDAEQRALITGEEKFLPARDKGRARRYVRDYVDARRSFAEWIMALMMVSIILLLGLSTFANRVPLQWQAYMLYGSSILMYGSFIVTAVEAIVVWRKIKRLFSASHPREDIPSGTGYYTFSRMIMPRRWRSPRPQVARGEYPA